MSLQMQRSTIRGRSCCSRMFKDVRLDILLWPLYINFYLGLIVRFYARDQEIAPSFILKNRKYCHENTRELLRARKVDNRSFRAFGDT